jgi:RND superfamily putative drug exporter
MEKMGHAGRVYPIQMVVRRKDGKPIVDGKSLKALAGVVRELKRRPEVDSVDSVVAQAPRLLMMSSLMYGGDVRKVREKFPEAIALLLSEDIAGTVIQVTPRNDASFKEVKDFVRGMQTRNWAETPGMAGMEVAFAGPAAVNNDFEHAILSNIWKVMALVFGVTFVLLAWTFRSIVLPLKALAMNTLSTAASFGALVLVFQHGFMSWAVGFPEPPGNILVPIPIIVFCLVFGLSMDYEVFLLSRIQEEYLECGDNERAVARGLAATGGIITNAALIMLLVFGSFVAASLVLTKMLGFGLAAAVLLDALVIRVALVPAFMALVGKWNWWPNIVEPKAAEAAATPEPVGSAR